MSTLRLMHWEPNGPWLRPLIALHEKGLAFESVWVDVPTLAHHVGAPVTDEVGFGSGPEGETPVLIDHGCVVHDSQSVLLYLEDAYPRVPLGPGTAREHAAMLAWARFVGEVLAPAAGTLGCQRYLVPRLAAGDRTKLQQRIAGIRQPELRAAWQQALDGAYPSEQLAAAWRRLRLGAERVERALGSTGYLVGAGYTLADIDAFAVCHALPVLTPEIVNEQGTPRLVHWIQRIRQRAAVQAALADGREASPEKAFAPAPRLPGRG